MKIAYLDCSSGISGDMMLGALVDAGADLAQLQAGIESLGMPACRLRVEEVKRRGFRGLQLHVEAPPEQAHRHLHHITRMIEASRLTPRQKELATRIFSRLGEAEARVHGTSVEKVHFHEVGAVDSIADVVGTAIGFDLLGVDEIVSSPVPTGAGFVTIAHGRVSVPAPATAELLKGVPLVESRVSAELTTPTGAAIVATLVSRFGPVPAMVVETIGCGAGSRDFEEQANLLRLMVGRADEHLLADQVWVLETNLDDISGEIVGYVTSLLLDAGALDVYTTPIQMKKNRPGVKLTVLCQTHDVAALERTVFRETTALGIRRWPADRHKLERRRCVVQTKWGTVEGKLATLGDGTARFTPEFECCRRLAADNGIALLRLYQEAQEAFDQGGHDTPPGQAQE